MFEPFFDKTILADDYLTLSQKSNVFYKKKMFNRQV